MCYLGGWAAFVPTLAPSVNCMLRLPLNSRHPFTSCAACFALLAARMGKIPQDPPPSLQQRQLMQALQIRCLSSSRLNAQEDTCVPHKACNGQAGSGSVHLLRCRKLQIPINARVKALEAGIPQQQERLAEHLEGKAAALPGEQAPLLTRVEALERAMAALLKAQVPGLLVLLCTSLAACAGPHEWLHACGCKRALSQHLPSLSLAPACMQEAANTNSHEDKVDGAKTGCCGCTIM